MSLEKVISQLRRDAAGNPKKAALLGLMVLVALYFWAPLVWQWLPAGAGKRKSKVDVSALILTDDPADPNQASKGRSGPAFPWERVRELIRQDPRMVSAMFDATWIDPFGKPAPTKGDTEIAVAAPPTATLAAAVVTEPTAGGLTLEGILIGPRTKVATINGEPRHEGDTIVVTDANDKTQGTPFRVVRISRRQVELACQGHAFILEVAPPKLANGDDILRGPPSGGDR